MVYYKYQYDGCRTAWRMIAPGLMVASFELYDNAKPFLGMRESSWTTWHLPGWLLGMKSLRGDMMDGMMTWWQRRL